MLKKTKKFALNFKILRFFLIPAVLVSTTLFSNIQNVRAGLEFQWESRHRLQKIKVVSKRK